MAKLTLGPHTDTREEVTYEELTAKIAETLNAAKRGRTIRPQDVGLVTQEEGRGHWGYSLKPTGEVPSMIQKSVDENAILELHKKYRYTPPKADHENGD